MSWRDSKSRVDIALGVLPEFPCKSCEKRHAGCHAECHEYRAAAEKHADKQAKYRAQRILENEVNQIRYAPYNQYKQRRKG